MANMSFADFFNQKYGTNYKSASEGGNSKDGVAKTYTVGKTVEVSHNPFKGVAETLGVSAVEGTKQAYSGAKSFTKTSMVNSDNQGLENAYLAVQNNISYPAYNTMLKQKYKLSGDSINYKDKLTPEEYEMAVSAFNRSRLGIVDMNDWQSRMNKQTSDLAAIDSERRAANAASQAKLQAVDDKYQLGKVGEFATDVAGAAGQMAPSLALGMINPALGLGTLGTQVAAQSYGQAMDSGATHEEAMAYGALEGLKEASIEKLVGGMGKAYGGGLLDNALLKTRANDSLKNVAINTAKGMTGEGAEEALAGYLDPIIERATYNPDAQNATAEELAYQAAIGAALGGIMGGGSNLVGYGASRRANKPQQSYNNVSEAVAAQEKPTQQGEIEPQRAQNAETINYTTEEVKPIVGQNNEAGAVADVPQLARDKAMLQDVSNMPQEVERVPQEVAENAAEREAQSEALERIMLGEGTKAMSEEERRVKRFIDLAAANANMSVVYEDMPSSRKAYYENGTIHVNNSLPLNAQMKTVAAHEIYHGLKGSKEHEQIINLAMQGNEAALVRAKQDEYRQYANIELSEQAAREEIAADFVEKAFTDEATIERVLLESPSLARRIVQFIKDMIDVYSKRKTMSKEDLEAYRGLLKARRLYEQGLAKLSSGKYTPSEQGIRYAINKDSGESGGEKYRFFDNTFANTPIFEQVVKDDVSERGFERDVVSEKESIAKAEKRLSENGWENEIDTILRKNDFSSVDTDVAMGIISHLNDYEAGSINYERILHFAEQFADKTVESGRTIQALAKYTRTPTGKTQKAMRDISKEAEKVQEKEPKKWNKVQKSINKAKKEYQKAQKEAIDEVTGEATGDISKRVLKKAKDNNNETATVKENVNKVRKSVKGVKKAYKQAQKEDINEVTANVDYLAQKIGSHVEDSKADTVDNAKFQKQIINELYRLAKESPLPDKAINVQKVEYPDLLREILHNKEKYEGIWQEAREMVGAKYKGDSEKMQALDDYFNNGIVPIYSKASLEKVIKSTMDKLNIRLNDVIAAKKGDKQAALQEIKDTLAKDLDFLTLDKQTIDEVAYDISNRLDNMLKVKAEQAISRYLKAEVKDSKKRLSAETKMLRMIRNGSFNEEEAARILKKAFDIPTLTTEETKQIMDYYEKADEYAEGSYEYRKWEAKANQIIANKTPKSFSEKNKAIRRIAMLLNPATMLRNFNGNIIFNVAEAAKNVPAGLVDMAVAKKTGKRTTSANILADVEAFAQGAKRGAQEWYQDIQYGVDTSYNAVREEYQTSGGKSFNDDKTIGKALNKLEYIMSKGLQSGDRPFFEGAYSQRINELERLGYDVKSDTIQMQAKMYALERVYQNDSEVSKRLTEVRNRLGLFGHFLVPFSQTPGNILDKTIDYSGAGGLAKALYQIGAAHRNGIETFDQKLFVDRIGRALTGSGIIALGMALGQMGILRGDDDDNYQVAGAERLAGVKPYSLKIGNSYYTVDWAQPVSALLIAGAEAYKAGLEADDPFMIATAAGKGVINTLFAMSCLEGLEALTSSYGNDSTADKIAGVFIGGVSQYFPTSIRRINNIIDPYQRQTYSPNALVKQAKYIISGIPILSYALEPKYNLEGELDMKSQGRGVADRIVENLLVPYLKAEEHHSVVNDEVLRLYESTGKTGQLLDYASKKLKLGDSGTYVLTAEEYNDMQRYIGQNTVKNSTALISSSVYKQMDDSERVEALSAINNYYKNEYMVNYAKENGIEYTNKSYDGMKEKLAKTGGWENYFTVKQSFPDATFDNALKYKATCDKYGIKYDTFTSAKKQISSIKDSNSQKYTKTSEKTEANKRAIAKYLAGLNLTNPQRQVLWEEANYSGKYIDTARKYGF